MFVVVSTEQTRLSPHWPWGSSVKTRCHRPYSPLRTGVIYSYTVSPVLILILTSFPHLSPSGTSTILAVYCQAPSKWIAALYSFTRFSFPRCQTFRLVEVSLHRLMFLKWPVILSFNLYNISLMSWSKQCLPFNGLRMCLQVSVLFWKSTSLCSWSTLQASSKSSPLSSSSCGWTSFLCSVLRQMLPTGHCLCLGVGWSLLMLKSVLLTNV